MWLLSTARAELQFFVSPESVPSPGFAILSHVWQQDEQTFQQLQALHSKCASTGDNPRDFASEKIRKCCRLAQRHGYAWLWVDTCCIDKTSSAELSEAINSMFRYYSAAGICYAFLQDVPLRRTDNIPDLFLRSLETVGVPESTRRRRSGILSRFMQSKWYSRGWTLQELIAPRTVLFLSESWDVLASKAELAVLIEDITGIPTTVLRLQKPLAYFSIAQRMSWVAKRVTTRVEDGAYCLLGIFNINMPTLYGEGRRAFLRLQEEIMKQSPDTTLFAWERPGGSQTTLDCLFAPSSAYFAQCHAVRYNPRDLEMTSTLGSNIRRFWRRKGQTMVFSVSPHGVLARLPLMKDGDEVYGYLGWSTNGIPLFLQLGVSLGAHVSNTAIPSYRCIRVAKLSSKCITHATWKWKEVYIQAQQLEDSLVDAAPVCVSGMSFNYGYYSPFHFLQAHAPDKPIPTGKDSRHRLNNGGQRAQGCIWLDSAKTPPLPWTGTPPAEFTLTCEGTSFVLSLGLCTIEHSHPSKQSLQHWANIRLSRIRGERLRRSKSDHDCLTDHISAWPDRIRTVTLKTDEHFRFTLAFTRCMINPTHTLDLDISSDRQIAFTSDGNPGPSYRPFSVYFQPPAPPAPAPRV